MIFTIEMCLGDSWFQNYHNFGIMMDSLDRHKISLIEQLKLLGQHTLLKDFAWFQNASMEIHIIIVAWIFVKAQASYLL